MVSDFESNLLSIFDNKATETMVPRNAPPNIPRFVLSSKKKRVLEVGPVSATYKSNTESLTIVQAVDLYQEKTRAIFKYLNSKPDIVKLESFKTTNLIHYPLIKVDYPIEDDIRDNFLKVEKTADFKAASLTIVWKSGHSRFTNVIDAYEKKDINMSAKEIISSDVDSPLTRIPISSFKVSERGLVNKIIIMQDPDEGASPGNIGDRFNQILDITVDKIKNHADSFIFKEK